MSGRTGDDTKKRIQELETVIEEQEETIQKLGLSRKKCEFFIHAVPDIVYQLDAHGNIVFINDMIVRYGYTTDELIGRNIIDIVHPEDRDIACYRLNERRTGERCTRDVEVRFLTGNKDILDVEIRSNKVWDNPVLTVSAEGLYASDKPEKTGFIGTIGIARDITERKKAEQEIIESEERYGTLFNAVSDAILVGDKEMTCIIDANDKAVDMYGYTKEELLQLTALDLSAEPDKSAEFIKSQKGTAFVPIRYHKKKDGTVFPVEISASFYEYRGKNIVISTNRDISSRIETEKEREQFEEQYYQSQKMESIGRLAGGIAHDFNNLLTVITGTSELMLMDLEPDSQMYANVNEINNTAERAASLTRQLLTFSRKQIIETKVLNLNDTLFSMDKMLRRLIGEDIELVFIPCQDLWPIKADPGQMEQVLTNLVVNARDAMRKGGKLTIETANYHLDAYYAETHPDTTPGDYIMMAVSDTGIGMDEDTRSKVFEPFFTTKDKGQGTGLGLSTCYGIVKQNGGNIRVYSEPGVGSTFKVYLPRTYESRGEDRKSTEEDLPGGTETILVAEDEPAVRKMIHRILSGRGYTVIEASHGDEAVAVATEYTEPIHLLLTDIIMPHMGGKGAAKIIQCSHPGIHILFMSGYTDNSIVHHGVLDPGVAFLQKPFTPQSLLKKIRDVLDN